MMRKTDHCFRSWRIPVALLWLMSWGLYMPTASAYSLSISQDQIQKKLDKKFPIRRDKGFFWAELSHPKPHLKPETNELGLSLDLHYRLLDKHVKTGKIYLLGKPAYDPVAGEFYLHTVKIVSFELPGARVDQAYVLRKQLAKVAKKKLKRVKLYRLKDSVRDQLLKAFIQGVCVQPDRVVVTFGLSQ